MKVINTNTSRLKHSSIHIVTLKSMMMTAEDEFPFWTSLSDTVVSLFLFGIGSSVSVS